MLTRRQRRVQLCGTVAAILALQCVVGAQHALHARQVAIPLLPGLFRVFDLEGHHAGQVLEAQRLARGRRGGGAEPVIGHAGAKREVGNGIDPCAEPGAIALLQRQRIVLRRFRHLHHARAFGRRGRAARGGACRSSRQCGRQRRRHIAPREPRSRHRLGFVLIGFDQAFAAQHHAFGLQGPADRHLGAHLLAVSPRADPLATMPEDGAGGAGRAIDRARRGKLATLVEPGYRRAQATLVVGDVEYARVDQVDFGAIRRCRARRRPELPMPRKGRGLGVQGTRQRGNGEDATGVKLGMEQMHGYPCHGFYSGRVEKHYGDKQIAKMTLCDQGQDLPLEGAFGRAEYQTNLTGKRPAPLA